jgi:hypothetical protein
MDSSFTLYENGNFEFRQGNIEAAMNLYDKALMMLDLGSENISDIRIKLLLNSAQCKLLLRDYLVVKYSNKIDLAIT